MNPAMTFFSWTLLSILALPVYFLAQCAKKNTANSKTIAPKSDVKSHNIASPASIASPATLEKKTCQTPKKELKKEETASVIGEVKKKEEKKDVDKKPDKKKPDEPKKEEKKLDEKETQKKPDGKEEEKKDEKTDVKNLKPGDKKKEESKKKSVSKKNSKGEDKKDEKDKAVENGKKEDDKVNSKKKKKEEDKKESKKSFKASKKGNEEKADSPLSNLATAPPVIDEENVQKLGNLDVEIKDKRAKLVAEVEQMSSQHEFDKKQQKDKVVLPADARIVINEKKCKMYETNNEETKEDEPADDLI